MNISQKWENIFSDNPFKSSLMVDLTEDEEKNQILLKTKTTKTLGTRIVAKKKINFTFQKTTKIEWTSIVPEKNQMMMMNLLFRFSHIKWTKSTIGRKIQICPKEKSNQIQSQLKIEKGR